MSATIMRRLCARFSAFAAAQKARRAKVPRAAMREHYARARTRRTPRRDIIMRDIFEKVRECSQPIAARVRRSARQHAFRQRQRHQQREQTADICPPGKARVIFQIRYPRG